MTDIITAFLILAATIVGLVLFFYVKNRTLRVRTATGMWSDVAEEQLIDYLLPSEEEIRVHAALKLSNDERLAL